MKAINLIRNKMRKLSAVGLSVLMLMLIPLISCEENENQSKYNPPSDHTINQDGVLHKSGLYDPLTNCVSCHGSDLQGGSAGVSCYECHGKKW